jgi:hypothetical protein
MVWTTIYSVPNLLIQAAWLLLVARTCKFRLGAWMSINGITVLALIGWVLHINMEQLFWIPVAHWRELANTFLIFAGGRFSNDTPAPHLLLPFSLDGLLAILLYLSAGRVLWVAFKKNNTDFPNPAMRGHTLTLLGWLFAAPIAWYIYNHLREPCFLYRYFLFASFPLYLLVGAAFASINHTRLKVAFLVVLLALFGYQHSVRLHSTFRPDYRAALARVLQEDEPSNPDAVKTPILVLKKRLNAKSIWYASDISEERTPVVYGISSLHEQSVALAREHGALWVLMWRWDRVPEFLEELEKNYITSELHTLGGMPPLHLFHLKSP